MSQKMDRINQILDDIKSGSIENLSTIDKRFLTNVGASIQEILFEEIQKEINADIIRTVVKTSINGNP